MRFVMFSQKKKTFPLQYCPIDRSDGDAYYLVCYQN
jgi:hypothetical protein